MLNSKDIRYIGVYDEDLELFEGQYPIDSGVTYNSYIILDNKITIMDSVDERAGEKWLQNIEYELDGKEPNYIVVSHMEPDHSGSLKLFLDKYPDCKIVGNLKTFMYLAQMFQVDNIEDRKVVINEGDILDLGNHKLKFIMASMCHWPEVMFTYESTEKILFSADAFGTFGKQDDKENDKENEVVLNWPDEARRYYINIVGKYGVQVQGVLAKLKDTEIATICPLHGSVLSSNISYYIGKYDIWSKYEAEDEDVVIACSSMHGNTLSAAINLKELIEKNTSKNVFLFDLCTQDITDAVSYAFKCKNLIVASPTYNGELFPATDSFIRLLKSKGYQNRRVGLIENGTWAPMSVKQMKEQFETFKNIEFIEPFITIKSVLNDATIEQLNELVSKI